MIIIPLVSAGIVGCLYISWGLTVHTNSLRINVFVYQSECVCECVGV